MKHPISILQQLKALADSAITDHGARYECFGSADDLAAVAKLQAAAGMLATVIDKLDGLLPDVMPGGGAGC
ncbi:hypothetical protein GCM10023116_27690 [Kistimonas scapharcae]|uniref:Uncharacterized protein n=1 Tax=Kistimonas scapharcae TaxID=1036133 RepID=A0ABP8V3I4_9GAMM